jgi:hypothetical protein
VFLETKITYRIATEVSPGEDKPVAIADKLSHKKLLNKFLENE